MASNLSCLDRRVELNLVLIVMTKTVPESVCSRLSLYYRALENIHGSEIVSSNALATFARVTAAQVRRDLHYFGHFGIPGKGYRAGQLKHQLVQILGIDKSWRMALVGVGSLGSAFLASNEFERRGFQFVCAFDCDESKIGTTIHGMPIRDIRQLKPDIQNEGVEIAAVVVPGSSARSVIHQIIEAGVTAIFNFTPYRPGVIDSVQIVNLDLFVELEKLSYYLRKKWGGSQFFWNPS